MVTFKNILFPINLDSTNLSFVKKVLDIAQQLNGRLHILYVNDEQAGYRHPTDREDAVALKVQEAVPEDLLSKVSPVYAIAKGNLAEQIEAKVLEALGVTGLPEPAGGETGDEAAEACRRTPGCATCCSWAIPNSSSRIPRVRRAAPRRSVCRGPRRRLGTSTV